jgi:hypothetical protein
MLKLNDFARDTQTLGYTDQHVRAFSGRSSVGRVPGSVTGMERFFCPPFAAGELAMTMDIQIPLYNLAIGDSALVGHGIPQQLLLQEERWHPSFIWRRGTFHRRGEGGLVSLELETWLVPSALDDSVLLKFRVKNRSAQELVFRMEPNWSSLRFGDSLPEQWSWFPPVIETDAAEMSPGIYRSGNVVMRASWAQNPEPGAAITLGLRPGESTEKIFCLSFSRVDEARAFEADGFGATSIEASLRQREQDWDHFWSKAPHLEASNKKLEAAYNHSLLTFFLCRWTSPYFAVRPHYAEAGINGGALCNYLWGEANASKMMAIIEGAEWKPSLIAHMGMGIDEHYAFEPLTGKGVGPFYSYNAVSLTQAVEDYIHWTGDEAFLDEKVAGVLLSRKLVQLIDDFEGKFPQQDGLIDFGDNHHLLEMRSSGYEHFVPSPNGERVRMYRFLADVLEKLGDPAATDYRKRAEHLRRKLVDKLWDHNTGWLKCLYPDGASELVYSIQIFDLLGRGILDREQEQRILSRLNAREFLSPFGVHSVSKTDDCHFDLGDVDWSGPGCFVGDPSNLLEELFSMNEATLAWDVMERLLWWSEKYPYWPQCIRAAKQDYSHWEQPANRTALAFAQAIVFGMFGLTLKEQCPVFEPHLPEGIGKLKLSNVRVLGATLEYEHADGQPCNTGVEFTTTV